MSSLFVVVLIALAALLLLALARRKGKPRPTVRRAVVCLVSGERLLVMRRMEGERPADRLELPKGQVGRTEDPLEAAYRECLEESGLRPEALEPLTCLEVRRGKKRRREVWEVFWGALPSDTSFPAKHRVTGQGKDRGRVYRLSLLPLEQVALQPPLEAIVPVLKQRLAARPVRPPTNRTLPRPSSPENA